MFFFADKLPLTVIEQKIKPQKADLESCVLEIQNLFSDGFHINHIGSAIGISLKFLDRFFDLSLAEKRSASLQILTEVIDRSHPRIISLRSFPIPSSKGPFLL